MDWEALRDNLGLLVFLGIWLLSFLMRAARGKSDGRPLGPIARRRRARRRAMIVAFLMMALAVGAWELSRGVTGEEAAFFRLGAAGLAVVALLAILYAGALRPGDPLQGGIEMESPEERAAEISAGEPLEPN